MEGHVQSIAYVDAHVGSMQRVDVELLQSVVDVLLSVDCCVVNIAELHRIRLS
jgi:hypothetical protein